MKALRAHQPAAPFYEALGLSADASPEAIKTAWRRVATLHHPDKHGRTEPDEVYIAAKQAYDVLINPDLKAQYDEFGGVQTDLQLDRAAHGCIADILRQILDQCDPNFKILNTLRDTLHQGIKQVPVDIASLKSAEKQLHILRKNIQDYWTGPVAIKEMVRGNVEAKLESNRQARAELAIRTRIMKRAQELLANADYKLPEPKPVMVSFGYGTATVITWG